MELFVGGSLGDLTIAITVLNKFKFPSDVRILCDSGLACLSAPEISKHIGFRQPHHFDELSKLKATSKWKIVYSLSREVSWKSCITLLKRRRLLAGIPKPTINYRDLMFGGKKPSAIFRTIKACLSNLIKQILLETASRLILPKSQYKMFCSYRGLSKGSLSSNLLHESDYMFFKVNKLINTSFFGLEYEMRKDSFYGTSIDPILSSRRPIILLSPFAQDEYRCIPASESAKLLSLCLKKLKTYPAPPKVVLCGIYANYDLNMKSLHSEIVEVVKSMDYFDFINRLSLGRYLQILRACNILITADSFPLHAAMSIRKKTFVYAGGGHMARFVDYGNMKSSKLKKDVLTIFSGANHLNCFNCDWLCSRTQEYECCETHIPKLPKRY